jgi:hypothetical protein
MPLTPQVQKQELDDLKTWLDMQPKRNGITYHVKQIINSNNYHLEACNPSTKTARYFHAEGVKFFCATDFDGNAMENGSNLDYNTVYHTS